MLGRALDQAGRTIDGIDLIDIYSCFPSAIEIATEALGIPENDARGLTLTGGMPFFGGPGNNYSMHAIAEAVARCRSQPGERVMVTANSGYLTKHAIGIYSSQPPARTAIAADRAQSRVDALPVPAVTESPDGAATIETYTVAFHRGEPARGIVIGRLRDGNARFIANTPHDADLFAAMCELEFVGAAGRASGAGGMNVFTPD